MENFFENHWKKKNNIIEKKPINEFNRKLSDKYGFQQKNTEKGSKRNIGAEKKKIFRKED